MSTFMSMFHHKSRGRVWFCPTRWCAAACSSTLPTLRGLLDERKLPKRHLHRSFNRIGRMNVLWSGMIGKVCDRYMWYPNFHAFCRFQVRNETHTIQPIEILFGFMWSWWNIVYCIWSKYKSTLDTFRIFSLLDFWTHSQTIPHKAVLNL